VIRCPEDKERKGVWVRGEWRREEVSEEEKRKRRGRKAIKKGPK
jgi:hypothetical protein